MSRELRIRVRADWELDDIVEYIARRDPRAAVRVRERIEATFQRILDSPYGGTRKDTPDGTFWVRSVLRYPQFVIIYQITDEAIDVVRIIRGRRDLRLFDPD